MPTFHESIRIIVHRPWALLHDEAAHLLRNQQGPGEGHRAEPECPRVPPAAPKREDGPRLGVSQVPRSSGHPKTLRWERSRAIGCR